MFSPKAYLNFAIGALVLPSYLGLESAAASVQDKVNVSSSLEVAPVVQKQTNPDSSLQIAEYDEAEIDRVKGNHRCYRRPRKVNYYRVYKPVNYRCETDYGHEENNYGHGRRNRNRYRDNDDYDSHDRYDHEDYKHETVHFGGHRRRHGRNCH